MTVIKAIIIVTIFSTDISQLHTLLKCRIKICISVKEILFFFLELKYFQLYAYLLARTITITKPTSLVDYTAECVISQSWRLEVLGQGANSLGFL
jgi:hypothetical protein